MTDKPENPRLTQHAEAERKTLERAAKMLEDVQKELHRDPAWRKILRAMRERD